MPGLDYLSNDDRKSEGTVTAIAGMPAIESQRRGVYYNPRLDPKNYLEGPLSSNPSTRLRQMLARPGIVVSTDTFLMGTRSESRLHFQKVAPGICDGISARCALEAGFTCLYQRYGSRKKKLYLCF